MKLARAAILIALLLSAVTVAALLLFDPPVACPGWHVRDLSLTSIWLLLAVWTAPYWLAEGNSSPLVPNEHILARMCVVRAVASQFPLLLAVDCLGV